MLINVFVLENKVFFTAQNYFYYVSKIDFFLAKINWTMFNNLLLEARLPDRAENVS